MVDFASVIPEIVEAYRIPALERIPLRAGGGAFDQFTEALCNTRGGLLVFEVSIPTDRLADILTALVDLLTM